MELFCVRTCFLERTRKRLERFRVEDDAGWVEMARRGKEPRIMFQLCHVRPIMLALLEEMRNEQGPGAV
jgi:hypothetical protein